MGLPGRLGSAQRAGSAAASVLPLARRGCASVLGFALKLWLPPRTPSRLPFWGHPHACPNPGRLSGGLAFSLCEPQGSSLGCCARQQGLSLLLRLGGVTHSLHPAPPSLNEETGLKSNG